MSGKEFRSDRFVFCFEHSKKCKRTGIRFIRGRKFLDKGDLLYSFREHIIQANRRNSSRRGVCGLNLFSHLRSIVCRFERSGDISAPKHRISPTVVLDIQALALSSTCPGDARRFLRRRIIIFLTVMSTCFLSKFALWACCVSLYPGRCNRVIAGGSFSFLGSSRVPERLP